MRDWEMLSIAQASPGAVQEWGHSTNLCVTCRVLTKPYVSSVPDFMCWVAQGPITEVSTYTCVCVLNWDVVLHWDQFPTALATLVFSVEPAVKSFGLSVCSCVGWWHPAGWGFVVLL